MASLRALEAFGFLMLKYAFSHILETHFPSFLTASSIPKTDKKIKGHITLYFNQFEIFLCYRSGMVNSKSFVGKVLLQIKWKFELN